MELYTAVNPMILTSIARLLPEDPNYTLNACLPDRQVPQIEVAIDQIKQINTAAKFRSWDAPVEIGKNPTFTRQIAELPPLGQGYLIGEYRRLLEQQLTMPGASINPMIERYATNYVERGVRAIRARMEVARGQMLSTGTFVLTAEGGLTGMSADFGVPSGNKATAGTLWSDRANANPISDLQLWSNAMHDAYGIWPDRMVLGKGAAQDLLNNAKIRIQLGSLLGAAPAASVPQVNSILAAMDLPEIATTPDGRPVRPARVDVDGSTVDTFPTNIVSLYADSAVGETLWGPTFNALEMISDGMMEATDAPGITAVVERDGNPGQLFTTIDAVGMPVLTTPWGLFIATVG